MVGKLVFVGLVVFGLGFIALIIYRRRTTFSGVVIDKNVEEQVETFDNTNQPNSGGLTINTSPTGGVTHTYTAVIKADDGKTHHWQISSGMYETLNIGDRVNKPVGTSRLTIVQKAAPTQPPTQPPVPPTNTIAN